MSDIVARMDDWGRPAWIALMILAFIVFWPLGLAMLAFMIGSGRMSCRGYAGGEPGSRWERKMARFQEKMERWGRHQTGRPGFSSTGNAAFDEYRDATLQRLEEEAREFKEFLDRLRQAKDKQEFDQFMAERRSRPDGNGAPASP